MRTKSLLNEFQSYLKAELELSQIPTPAKPEKPALPAEVAEHRAALAQKVESDRSRLLREVEIESAQAPTLEHVPFKRVLVAVDASPQAMAAIDLAVRLSHAGGVKFCLLHVVDDAVGMYEGFAAPVSIVGERCLAKQRAHTLLKSAMERFAPPCHGMDETPMPEIEMAVREGPVVTKIVEAAGEFGADLILLGTHGRRGISHLFMGSTAEGVIREAACPVLSVSSRAAEKLAR